MPEIGMGQGEEPTCAYTLKECRSILQAIFETLASIWPEESSTQIGEALESESLLDQLGQHRIRLAEARDKLARISRRLGTSV
jgi:hypothetical protein